MTLDEAIIHCQEKSCGDTECAREHKQLGEWLVELKQRREQEEPSITEIVDKHFWEMLGEEPVGEELEQAIDVYLKSYWGGEKEKQDWPFLKKMAIHFADWQKEQIEKALLSEVLPCFMHGGEADEVVAKLDEVLSQKK